MEESISILIATGVLVYFLPFYIAWFRRHHNKAGVFLINLLFGWTVIGWLGIFIYATLSSTSSKNDNKDF